MKVRIVACALLYLGHWLNGFAQQELELYPNPFEDELFFITTPACGDSIQLEIYTIWGSELIKENKHQVLKPDTIQYQLALSTGVYVLRYLQNQEEVLKKVIHAGDSTMATINMILSNKNLNCFETPFEIFPNPMANGTFTIRQQNLALPYEVSVHDAAGNLVLKSSEQNRTTATQKFDLTHKADGVYFISIKAGDELKTEKFLLLHN